MWSAHAAFLSLAVLGAFSNAQDLSPTYPESAKPLIGPLLDFKTVSAPIKPVYFQ